MINPDMDKYFKHVDNSNNITQHNIYNITTNIPYCHPTNLNGKTPVIDVNNVDNMITILKKLNMGEYVPFLEHARTGRKLCDNPSQTIIKSLCEVEPFTTKFMGGLSKHVYDDEHKAITYDLTKSKYYKYYTHEIFKKDISHVNITQIIPRTMEGIKLLKAKYNTPSNINHIYNTTRKLIKRGIKHVARKRFWTHEIHEHVDNIQNSNIIKFVKSSIRTIKYKGGEMIKHAHHAIFKLTFQVPKTIKMLSMMHKHYRSIAPKIYGKRKNLTSFENYVVQSSLLSKNDFRRTEAYHIHLHNPGEKIKKWTGFSDPTREFHLHSLPDLANGVACLFCYTFHVDCCNATGCNKGAPWPVIPDPDKCFYPIFVGPPIGYTIWPAGFDPFHPQCGHYRTPWGWLQGASWAINTWWLGPKLNYYVGFQKWIGWLVYDYTGDIPPNLIICLIINMLWGSIFVVSFGVFLIGFSILLRIANNIETAMNEKRPEQSQIPSLLKLLSQTKKNILKIGTESKNFLGNTISEAKGAYKKIFEETNQNTAFSLDD